MTVVPGFIDTHNHAAGEGLLYDVLVGNPYEVEFVTIASIVDKLRGRGRKRLRPAPGSRAISTTTPSSRTSGRSTCTIWTRSRPSIPSCVHHRGGHTAFYNSKALQMAGVTKTTPNPPGGTYDRNQDGELNGRVTDRATAVFDKVGKRATYSPRRTQQRDRDGLAYHLQAVRPATA